jgi:hypothetical protein
MSKIKKRASELESSHKTKNTELEDTYYNPSTGLQGIVKLYEKVKKFGYTLKEVTDFLNDQLSHQVHLQSNRLKHYFPIKAAFADQIWQVDLMDVSKESHHNKGYNYLLCIVDIYSRFAQVIPLKKKDTKHVMEAITNVLLVKHPKIIMSDNGSEFISRKWKALMKKYDIEMRYSEPGDHNRMGIVERFNKTLRGLIGNYRSAYDTDNYIDVLQDLVNNYNNTVHSATQSTPSKPNAKKIQEIISDKEEKAEQELTEFNIGDKVRTILAKSKFTKFSEPKWSKVTYTIEEHEGREYKLSNGKWYKYYDIQPISNVQTTEAKPKETIKPIKYPVPLALHPKKTRIELKNLVNVATPKRAVRERQPSQKVILNAQH